MWSLPVGLYDCEEQEFYVESLHMIRKNNSFTKGI